MNEEEYRELYDRITDYWKDTRELAVMSLNSPRASMKTAKRYMKQLTAISEVQEMLSAKIDMIREEAGDDEAES